MSDFISATGIAHGTSSEWSSTNQPIPAGMLCYETDTKYLKIGNGVGLYSTLPYLKQETISSVLKSIIDTLGSSTGPATIDTNGTIPLVQLPDAIKNKLIFVNTITERNALEPNVRTSIVYVIDASDDPTVLSGAASYLWDFDNLVWVKNSEGESLDIDMGDYLSLSHTTLDAVRDGGIHVRTTPSERTQLMDLNTNAVVTPKQYLIVPLAAAVYTQDSPILMGTSDGTVAYSFDNGQSWTTKVVTSPLAAYATGKKNLFIVGTGNTSTYVSTNNGTTFTRATNGNSGAMYKTQYSSRSQRYLCGTTTVASSVRYSTDGISWPIANVCASGYSCTQGMTISQDGAFVMIGTTAGQLFRSFDGGISFDATTRLTVYNWAAFGLASNSDGSVIIAIRNGNNTIYRSTDYGVTWTSTTLNYFPYGAIYATGRFFLVGSNGRYSYSTDDGQTWTMEVIGGLTSVAWRDVSYANGRLVVCGSSGRYAQLNLTTNTWTTKVVGGSGYSWQSIGSLQL